MFEDETSAKPVNSFENVLSLSSSYWKISPHFKNNIFPKNHSFTLLFSVFKYSSELVLINEYVYGNQQHCVINKVRNYHDEVKKAVTDFHASKLK